MNEIFIATVSSNNTTVTMGPLNGSHDDNTFFKYRAYFYTYMLVFPVAFLGNIGALVVFFQRCTNRSSASQVVMINLAISDWGFSLTLPLRLAYYFREGIWNFPDWLCRVCVFGFYVNLYSSILLLTLLSFLRWLAVACPYKHREVATTSRVIYICLGIWVFVGGSSVPFLYNGIIYRKNQPRCFEPGAPSSWLKILILNYVGLVFGFLVPFFTIICCYTGIIRRLVTSTRPGSKLTSHAPNRHTKRPVYLITMVIVTFLLCFLPYHVIRSLHLHAVNGKWDHDVTQQLEQAVSVTLCMAASNSMINPLLYYYSTKTFRKDMREAQSSLISRGSVMRRNSQTQRKNS